MIDLLRTIWLATQRRLSGSRLPAAITAFYLAVFVIFLLPALREGLLLAPGDGWPYYLPAYAGPHPDWTGSLMSGFPMTADPEMMTWYLPARVLAFVGVPWNAFIILTYVQASVLMCALARTLSGSTVGGLVAGLVYGLSGFMVEHLGHATILQVAAWLPLLLLGLQQLKQGYSARWFLGTTLATTLCILGGHPQIAFFSLVLAGAFALGSGGRRIAAHRYFGLVGSAMVLGLGLSLVQLLPTAAIVESSIRGKIDFAFSSEFSLPLRHALTLVLPQLFGSPAGLAYPYYFAPVSPTEMTGYVGLLAPMLAAVALGGGRNRQVWFWTSVAVVALLLAVGPATPLARLLFYVPGFRNFRAPGRHLFEFTVAIALLAGYGIAVLERSGAVARRLVGWTSVISSLCLVACLVYVWVSAPSLFEPLGHPSPRTLAWPWRNLAVGLPCLLFVFQSAGLFAFAIRPRVASAGVVLALLAFDSGAAEREAEWREDSQPSARVDLPAPIRDRALDAAARGQRIALAERPSNLPLLWGLPQIGGQSSLEPAAQLLVRNLTRLPPNRLFDLLAVRYALLPYRWLIGPDDDIQLYGLVKPLVPYAAMEVPLGPACAAHASPTSPPLQDVTIPMPATLATEIGLVSKLTDAVDTEDGTPLVDVTVATPEGERHFQLRAGRETAEWAWERPDVRQRVLHRIAPVFDDDPGTDDSGRPYVAHRYYAWLRLPAIEEVESIRLRWIGPNRCRPLLSIDQLVTRNGPRHEQFQVPAMALALSDWRRVADSDGYVVFENPHALPRAWIASIVRSLPAEALLATIGSGRLPGGEPWDPAKIAFTATYLNLPESTTASHDQVDFRAQSETEQVFHTRTRRDALLVTSDRFAPGWIATIDGVETPIINTDYFLRSVIVPAGDHVVRIRFKLPGLTAGLWLSGGSGMGLVIGLMTMSRRRRRANPDLAVERRP